MKQTGSLLILFFVLLFAFVKLAGPIPLAISSVVTNKTDVFSVSGEGKVTLVPDIATVSVGVTAQGVTVTSVQQDLNKKMKAISDAVKKLGVDDKDIKTQHYSISPSYDFTEGRQRISGYQANASYIVKIRNLENINGVIDAATAGGANEVGSVALDVDDKTKAEDEARQLAIAEAKAKAQAAAKSAGFNLGRVISYNEGGPVGPQPPVMYDAALKADAPERATTQIEPGSSEVTMTVTLSYEIQ
jgi:uncharacterized protein YggE